MKTTLALEHEKAADQGSYVVRALLTISGDAPETTGRVPLNLSLVLDRSGSMGGVKLEQAKHAAGVLVSRLWPEDTVSIVAYDDVVETVAEPATAEQQPHLLTRLRGIEPRGSTNLSGGWLRGRELVAAGKREGGVNRVLLLTDGLANVGITEPDRLAMLCQAALEQGITTTTIGFGYGYDEVLLGRMADTGGGNTYYIENADQAPAVFEAEIEGLLSLSAQNLRVDLRPAPSARLVMIHHQYPSHRTGDTLRIELGDLFARTPRALLLEFLVFTDDPAAEVPIADVEVTGHVLGPKGDVTREEVHLPIRASLAGGPRTDPEVRRELLLQEAARARTEAHEARSGGDVVRAGRRLRGAADKLKAFGSTDETLREEARDLAALADRLEQGEMTVADAKYLYQRAYAASRSKPGTADAISRLKRRPER